MIEVFAVAKDKRNDAIHVFAEVLCEHLSAKYRDTAFLESIKQMQPLSVSIPYAYYYCTGFQDYYRMPLIYPYSVISIG